MNEAEIRRLSELRSLLEGFAARHAARNAVSGAEHLVRLRTALKRLTAAVRVRNYREFRQADFELHATIIEMSQVPLLSEAWQLAWDGLLTLHEQGFEDYFPDTRVLADEHEHLVETIALGDPIAAEDAATSHVEAVWFRVAENSVTAAEAENDPLQRATAHLAFSLHRPLKLTEVARKIAFTSPGNLSRLFRQHHGLSFQAYLQKLRLEKAAELLITTRLPIARIAKRVGYRDVSRFGQHFKRQFGKVPTEWRRSSSKNRS
ncbi:MAG: helix-turn-helix domain-containing protein [Prosthecobacter sp.]|uniref:AraC family transcriptional regulator n=1 Tax=Prosthecobacter sp. TaxID=1965333 RepID=UPI0038FE3620